MLSVANCSLQLEGFYNNTFLYLLGEPFPFIPGSQSNGDENELVEGDFINIQTEETGYIVRYPRETVFHSANVGIFSPVADSSYSSGVIILEGRNFYYDSNSGNYILLNQARGVIDSLYTQTNPANSLFSPVFANDPLTSGDSSSPDSGDSSSPDNTDDTSSEPNPINDNMEPENVAQLSNVGRYDPWHRRSDETAPDDGPLNDDEDDDDCDKGGAGGGAGAGSSIGQNKKGCKKKKCPTTSKNNISSDCNKPSNNGSLCDKKKSRGSYIDSERHIFIHDAEDWAGEIPKDCYDCGTESPASFIPQLFLKRYIRYHNLTQASSFGPGIFSNFDITVNLFNSFNEETNTFEMVIDLFDPQVRGNRRLFLEGDVFKSRPHNSISYAELLDVNRQRVTSPNQAAYFRLVTLEKNVFEFELYSTESNTKMGRWTKFSVPKGYGYEITYVNDNNNSVSSEEKRKINYVQDSTGRRLTFEYYEQMKGGSYIVSSITLPNGAAINYGYTGGNDGRLYIVQYPDKTLSKYNMFVDEVKNVRYFIDESGQKGYDRRKAVTYTSTVARTEEDFFNQEPALVRAVTKNSRHIYNFKEINGRQIVF